MRCVRKMNFSSILHVLNILASSFILSPTDNPTCAIRLIAWCCDGCLSWYKYNAFMRINESVKYYYFPNICIFVLKLNILVWISLM